MYFILAMVHLLCWELQCFLKPDGMYMKLTNEHIMFVYMLYKKM